MPAWPIEWHENNLKNFRESFAQKQAQVDRLVGELVRWEADILRRQMQIDEAKRLGKKAFDPDKFMKPKPPSAAGDEREEKS